MKRTCLPMAALAALSVPFIANAQTPAPIGNNPTVAGIYVEGLAGLNALNDIDFDVEGLSSDVEAETKAGFLGSLALGYNIPSGPINFRMEGEFAGRANEVDQVGVVELDNADATSLAFMANVHLDYYVIRNLAVTVGAGVGYAKVKLDLDVVDDDDSGFAYQGRVGARYSLGANSTIGLGYTYFATSELEITDEADDDATFDYENHGFHASYAYHF